MSKRVCNVLAIMAGVPALFEIDPAHIVADLSPGTYAVAGQTVTVDSTGLATFTAPPGPVSLGVAPIDTADVVTLRIDPRAQWVMVEVWYEDLGPATWCALPWGRMATYTREGGDVRVPLDDRPAIVRARYYVSEDLTVIFGRYR
jgi:hypothetical protein